MNDNLEFDAVMHRLLGPPCGIGATHSEWVLEQIAENLRHKNDFVRIDIEVFRADEEIDPAEGPSTIDRFLYWDENTGLQAAHWPGWFLARLYLHARRTRQRILPGPRNRPLLAGPQQMYLWPEDEAYLPPRREIRKLVGRGRYVTFLRGPEDLSIASIILEALEH